MSSLAGKLVASIALVSGAAASTMNTDAPALVDAGVLGAAMLLAVGLVAFGLRRKAEAEPERGSS